MFGTMHVGLVMHVQHIACAQVRLLIHVLFNARAHVYWVMNVLLNARVHVRLDNGFENFALLNFYFLDKRKPRCSNSP